MSAPPIPFKVAQVPPRPPTKYERALAKDPRVREAVELRSREPEVVRTIDRWRRRNRRLDPDLVEGAITWALVRACTDHRDGAGNEFCASLWRFLKWETDRALRRAGTRLPRAADFDLEKVETRPEDEEGAVAFDESLRDLYTWADRYLPTPVRHATLGYYLEGKTFKRIARELQIDRDRVAGLLEYGVGKLKEVAGMYGRGVA